MLGIFHDFFLPAELFKELCALRGFFGPPMWLKYKIVFHQFVHISLLEQ